MSIAPTRKTQFFTSLTHLLSHYSCTHLFILAISLISQSISLSVGVRGELGIDTKQRFRGSSEHSSNPENPVLHLTHSLTHSLLTHLFILAISLISQSISLSVGVSWELGIDTKQLFRGSK